MGRGGVSDGCGWGCEGVRGGGVRELLVVGAGVAASEGEGGRGADGGDAAGLEGLEGGVVGAVGAGGDAGGACLGGQEGAATGGASDAVGGGHERKKGDSSNGTGLQRGEALKQGGMRVMEADGEGVGSGVGKVIGGESF